MLEIIQVCFEPRGFRVVQGIVLHTVVPRTVLVQGGARLRARKDKLFNAFVLVLG